MSDIELVNLVKNNNCSKSLSELADRHNKLLFKVANKYAHAESGINIIDVTNDKYFILNNAIQKYDPSKSKFNTHYGNCVKFYCLSENKKNRYKNFSKETFKEAIYHKENSEDILHSYFDSIEQVIEILQGLPDKRISEVFKMRYEKDMDGKFNTWHKIGEKMGFSYQTASNLHSIGIEYIKLKLNINNT